jgi:hypothetical protein
VERIRFIAWTDIPSVVLGILLCIRLAAHDHGRILLGAFALLLMCVLAIMLRAACRLQRNPLLQALTVIVVRLFVIVMMAATVLTPSWAR